MDDDDFKKLEDSVQKDYLMNIHSELKELNYKELDALSRIVRDKDGNIIASTEESELFVAPYSEPIEGWFTKEEIEKHLMTREDVPDLFLLQHRNHRPTCF